MQDSQQSSSIKSQRDNIQPLQDENSSLFSLKRKNIFLQTDQLRSKFQKVITNPLQQLQSLAQINDQFDSYMMSLNIKSDNFQIQKPSSPQNDNSSEETQKNHQGYQKFLIKKSGNYKVMKDNKFIGYECGICENYFATTQNQLGGHRKQAKGHQKEENKKKHSKVKSNSGFVTEQQNKIGITPENSTKNIYIQKFNLSSSDSFDINQQYIGDFNFNLNNNSYQQSPSRKSFDE